MSDGNSYERQAALKSSNGLVCSMINAGLIKPDNIEDAFLVEESYYKRILARITEGIDTPSGTQTGFSTPQAPPSSDMVVVRLSDGTIGTKTVKDTLKANGFYWNKPEGSYDWNKRMSEVAWLSIKNTDPYDKLTATIKEE